MIIQVIRDIFDSASTEGQLRVDGTEIGFTLEPSKTAVEHPAIPAGTFEVILTYSPHFQRMMPLLLNVPGRSDIRIHPLNVPPQTEGCIGVALRRGKDEILQSLVVFNPLFNQIHDALERNEKVWCVITDEPAAQS